MAAMLQGMTGNPSAARFLPWIMGAMVALYFIGFTDGTVHASAIGGSTALAYVHEAFHHVRHVALMCH